MLSGANLKHLCTNSLQQYIELGVSLASDVVSLRLNRNQWRDAIFNSSLGDSNDLLTHLESTFSDLFSKL